MSKRDADQVKKVLAGDQAAYEPLVNAYQGRIFAFVAGRIRDFSATEDIVQNAFVEAYMHLKSLKSPEKIRRLAAGNSTQFVKQMASAEASNRLNRRHIARCNTSSFRISTAGLTRRSTGKNRNKRSRYSRRGCIATHLSGSGIAPLHGRHDLSRNRRISRHPRKHSNRSPSGCAQSLARRIDAAGRRHTPRKTPNTSINA